MIKKYHLTVFFACYLIYCLASNFVHPVTPAFLQQINCSNSVFGFAFAAMGLGQFIASPLWGKLGDKIGYARAVAIGYVGYAISAIVFGAAKSWHLVVLGRFIGGIGLASIRVNSIAYISSLDAPTEDRDKLLVMHASFMAIGGPFGFLIGGIIGNNNVYISFISQAVALLAGAALIFFLVKEHPNFVKSQEKLKFKDVNPLSSVMSGLKLINASMAMFLLSVLLSTFAHMGFDQNLNYFLRVKFDFAPSSSGMFKAVVGVFSLIINFTVNMWIVKKTNTAKSLSISLLLRGLFVVAMVLAPNQTGVLLFAIIYYGFYAIYTPLQQSVMLKNNDESSKGEVSGLLNAARSFGMMTGPAFAGLIFDINPNYAFLTFAAMLILSAAVAFVNYRQLMKAGAYDDESAKA